ncbi:MAG: hypothetical protein RL522_1516 [Pseudomonadota bacterium]
MQSITPHHAGERRVAFAEPVAPAQPPEPLQGLAARRVTILQMPRTLCRLTYGIFTTTAMAAGSAACYILGARASQDPESRLMGEQLRVLGAVAGLGAFTSLGATIVSVRQAYDEERAALAERRPAVTIDAGALGAAVLAGDEEAEGSRAEGQPAFGAAVRAPRDATPEPGERSRSPSPLTIAL